MSWFKHIQDVIDRATKFQTLYQCKLSAAYITLLRPMLECTNVAWDPHQQYLIDKIEMVQKQATRCVKQDYRPTNSVSEQCF